MDEFDKSVQKKYTHGGAREGSGRKPLEPTDDERKMVATMASVGVPYDQIAALIRDGIDEDTLKKHFRAELIVEKANKNANVGKCLYQKAMDGDTTAMIWWTKSQMRWREVQQHEISGRNGQPVQTLDLSKLDSDVLAQILAAKDAASSG